jgi:hypothetical protein
MRGLVPRIHVFCDGGQDVDGTTIVIARASGRSSNHRRPSRLERIPFRLIRRLPALVAGIHVFRAVEKDVDGRDKARP